MAPMEPADCEYCINKGEGKEKVRGFGEVAWLNGAFICVLLVLLEASRQCGSEALHYLGTLKDVALLESADCTAIRNCLRRIATIGEVSLCIA